MDLGLAKFKVPQEMPWRIVCGGVHVVVLGVCGGGGGEGMVILPRKCYLSYPGSAPQPSAQADMQHLAEHFLGRTTIPTPTQHHFKQFFGHFHRHFPLGQTQICNPLLSPNCGTQLIKTVTKI